MAADRPIEFVERFRVGPRPSEQHSAASVDEYERGEVLNPER